jgi:hypothetical protein
MQLRVECAALRVLLRERAGEELCMVLLMGAKRNEYEIVMATAISQGIGRAEGSRKAEYRTFCDRGC